LENTVKLVIHVHPKAARNSVVRYDGGVWHIKIAAPPIEGKANKELVEYLSKLLDIGTSRITIEKGLAGHRKTVRIEGSTLSSIEDILRTSIP